MSSNLEPFETRRVPSTQRRHGDLADVLERVLDKGVVIAGDISISLIDIELLTIKLRLLIASADKAREMGIDWWRHDPYLSGAARQLADRDGDGGDGSVRALEARLERLEAILHPEGQKRMTAPTPGPPARTDRPTSGPGGDETAAGG